MTVAAENVDLTFERKDGMIPGSGSSEKGLGKVVSAGAPIGDGLVEAEVADGRSEAVSSCKLGWADMLAGHSLHAGEGYICGLRCPIATSWCDTSMG